MADQELHDQRERAMAKALAGSTGAHVPEDHIDDYLDDANLALEWLKRDGWTVARSDEVLTADEAAAMVKNHEGELLGLGDTQPVLDGWSKLRRRASSAEGGSS
jgi:hypothetical protein